jgi:hypothetical protein
MPFDRESIRASVERAGAAHWQALIAHHEDPYPRPAPTPGDVCRAEAERLNGLGLGEAVGVTLLESRVRRIGEEIELTHVFGAGPAQARLLTEPFRNYAPDPPA